MSFEEAEDFYERLEQDERRAKREGTIPKRQSLARSPPGARIIGNGKKTDEIIKPGMIDTMYNKRAAEESPAKRKGKGKSRMKK